MPSHQGKSWLVLWLAECQGQVRWNPRGGPKRRARALWSIKWSE